MAATLIAERRPQPIAEPPQSLAPPPSVGPPRGHRAAKRRVRPATDTQPRPAPRSEAEIVAERQEVMRSLDPLVRAQLARLLPIPGAVIHPPTAYDRVYPAI